MSVNVSAKEVLAKLLATENLTVVHQQVETASFNVKDRVLTLPLWEDMENFTYDHLVGHEVAHALYTPTDDWMEIVKENPGLKSFVNVVEDARIEKLIQRKYPGLRQNFIKSYRKMLAEGFFGKTQEEINSFKLIDRINVFFKCGGSVGVQFTKEEMPWIREIENAETFEEVIDIAERLYGKAKEEMKKEQELKQELQQQMIEEMAEEEHEDFEENEFSEEDEVEGEGYIDSDDTEQDEALSEGNQEAYSNGVEEQEGPVALTDKYLEKNIRDEFSDDDTRQVFNLTLNFNDRMIEKRIVGYKTVLDSFYVEQIRHGGELYKKFLVNNKKTISYMVKEFEMKKRASEYKRATVSKTGVLDTLKMNNYQFSDDIFRKMTVLPEGKNHGLLMFVDWSGSMCDQIKNTIDQLINLVMFCRQVNIPYEVYAFSDIDHINKVEEYVSDNTICFRDSFRLIQLFSNRMSASDFTQMTKGILSTAAYFDDLRSTIPQPSRLLWLGGTPLNEAIISAFSLFPKFKKKNRLDIVNTIFLTDGASNHTKFATKNSYGTRMYQAIHPLHYYYSKDVYYITNPVTRKKHKYNTGYFTSALLRMLREYTQSNVIGYHILPARKTSALREIPSGPSVNFDRAEEMWEELRTNKFCMIPDFGYTAYFGILGGKNLETSNGAIQVSEDATKGQIRSAFKKANGSKKTSRVLLSKFIEVVA